MVDKNAHYLMCKGGVYYFTRHVPNDLKEQYNTPRIVICLKTRNKNSALTASKSIAGKLDDFWLQLRVANMDIPADEVENIEAEIKMHAKWMRDTHSYDESKIQLVHYYVSKSDELVNFTNPDEGTTGNVLFSINEVYVHPEGIGQHLDAAGAWPDAAGFFGVLGKYGKVLVINGEVIETL